MRFVDTNVLLYAISRDPAEQDKAKRANDILAERDLTLARLTTMGLQQGRQIWLVLGEALLTVIAAIAAGVACAVALPMLTGPALNLSVFTGSTAPVPIAPDLVALGVPAGSIGPLRSRCPHQLRSHRPSQP